MEILLYSGKSDGGNKGDKIETMGWKDGRTIASSRWTMVRQEHCKQINNKHIIYDVLGIFQNPSPSTSVIIRTRTRISNSSSWPTPTSWSPAWWTWWQMASARDPQSGVETCSQKHCMNTVHALRHCPEWRNGLRNALRLICRDMIGNWFERFYQP